MAAQASLMNKAFGFLFTLFFSWTALAAPAQVITETAVYETSNFDADVLVYLPINKKIQASKRIYKGKNFGSFRKVKITKSKYGFVSDIDIKLLVQLKKKKQRLKKRLQQLKRQDQFASHNVYFHSYAGLGVSFSRGLQSGHSPFTAFSFQLIGKTSVLATLPLSLSVSYLPDLPSYYKTMANTTNPKGYVLFADISYPIILYDYNNLLIYCSPGGTVRFIKGTVIRTQSSGIVSFSKKIKKIHFGVLANLGALWQLSNNIATKIDARYNYSNSVLFEELQISLMFKY